MVAKVFSSSAQMCFCCGEVIFFFELSFNEPSSCLKLMVQTSSEEACQTELHLSLSFWHIASSFCTHSFLITGTEQQAGTSDLIIFGWYIAHATLIPFFKPLFFVRALFWNWLGFHSLLLIPEGIGKVCAWLVLSLFIGSVVTCGNGVHLFIYIAVWGERARIWKSKEIFAIISGFSS